MVVHMCMHFLVNSVEFFINLLTSLSSLGTTTTCAKLLKNHGLATICIFMGEKYTDKTQTILKKFKVKNF